MPFSQRGKIGDIDRFGRPFWLPFLAPIGDIPHQFALLGIHRIADRWKDRRHRGDVGELGIAIGVAAAFGFLVAEPRRQARRWRPSDDGHHALALGAPPPVGASPYWTSEVTTSARLGGPVRRAALPQPSPWDRGPAWVCAHRLGDAGVLPGVSVNSSMPFHRHPGGLRHGGDPSPANGLRLTGR